MTPEEILQEFERQVSNLISKGYPKKVGKTAEEFLSIVKPLEDEVKQLTISRINLEKGYLPFILVVKNELLSAETAMLLVEKDGKQGITKLSPHQSKDFHTIDGENIPDSPVYLLVNVDRGKDNINLPPIEAMKLIRKAKRHPLTIDEGVAIVTQYPEFLIKNNCFSLLASRHPGDKRVPAIWINTKKHPNLGWCWDGNPHTWLGSASCGKRVGAPN